MKRLESWIVGHSRTLLFALVAVWVALGVWIFWGRL